MDMTNTTMEYFKDCIEKKYKLNTIFIQRNYGTETVKVPYIGKNVTAELLFDLSLTHKLEIVARNPKAKMYNLTFVFSQDHNTNVDADMVEAILKSIK